MAEMRMCKECGKLFLPKGREKYCPDTHYRPCPICGTPVVNIYLSDPPRKCDNCRGRRNLKPATNHSKLFNDKKFGFDDNKFKFAPKPAAESAKPESTPKVAQVTYTAPKIKTQDIITEIPETIDQKEFCDEVTGTVRRYVGPVIKNAFIPGHDYELTINHNDQTYGVKSDLDVTDHKEVNIFLHFTSQISINQNFARIKE